jgi:tetratricopeptide (TPR) repeat protein
MKTAVKILTGFLLLITLNLHAQNRASEALVEYRAGNYERAVQICRDDISENPNNLESHVIICWAFMRQSRYEEALRFARAGRAIHRFDVRIIQILGEIHYFQGLNNEALQYFQEYVSLTPEGQRVETIYYYMGEIFIRQGKFRHADIALSTAVHWVPGNAAWWVRLAYARENAGDLSTALEAYERALSLNSQLSDAQRGLDRIRRAMGGTQAGYSVQTAQAPAAAARPNLTGNVTVNNATPSVGDTVIASYTGNGSGTPVWQWLADDAVIAGANSYSYVVANNDVNRTIRARVSYANQNGSVTSAATRAVTNPVTRPYLTGSITINSTAPRVGDSITASYTGNGSGTAVWQWLADDAVISGTNSNTYVVRIGDIDKTIRARVSYANQNGNVLSAATRAVTMANLAGSVTIDNTMPRVGDTITASYTGNGAETVTWQWMRGDSVINGAAGRTYVVVNDDMSRTLRVRVSNTDFNGNITSSATTQVGRASLAGDITLSITTPKVGDIITASYTGNGSGTVTWQWMRNNSVIRGATNSTYIAGTSDVGRTLKVRVSYADQNDSLTSAPTAAVTRE